MTLLLERTFLPGTTVNVVPRPHLDGDPPRGPILATGTTDSRGFTTIPGLSKLGANGASQVSGSVLRCAVLPAAVMVGLTPELQQRVLTHT